MAISVYTGLMGSGKSFEVVRAVIVEAIAQGRRVVTNVDGISHERVRAYVAAKRKLPEDTLGSVVHVTNEDVFRRDFLPYYDDVKAAHTDTVVQPGDLVCIDEAWRFWGTGNKLLKEHQSFFLEHRHFTHTETGVACDLVLMIQDMGTLHRFVKAVVAFSFRTHKKVNLGLSNLYSVSMYEGWKQNKQTCIRTEVRKYNAEIFPLYQSFKDGAQGAMVNVDARQNLLRNPILWAFVALFVPVLAWAGWYLHHYFNPAPSGASSGVSHEVAHEAASDQASLAGTSAMPGESSAQQSAVSVAPSAWRIVGAMTAGGDNFVVIASATGRLRLESPSLFVNADALRMGEVDGQHVTTWSGPEATPSTSPAGLQ